jgi:hypothetical protein
VKVKYDFDPESEPGFYAGNLVAEVKYHISELTLKSRQLTKQDHVGAIRVIQQWSLHKSQTSATHNLTLGTVQWPAVDGRGCIPVGPGDLGRLLFRGFTQAHERVDYRQSTT